jgi:hypothetical protein
MGDAASAPEGSKSTNGKRKTEEDRAGVEDACKKRAATNETECGKCIITVPLGYRRFICPECRIEGITKIERAKLLHCLTHRCSGKPEWADYRPDEDDNDTHSSASESEAEEEEEEEEESKEEKEEGAVPAVTIILEKKKQ